MVKIFHITSRAEAAEAARVGSYVPEAYDRDGFIHCSYSQQVTRVANIHYRGREDMVLLEIDRERLSDPVVDENLDGGEELFPHIYGRLPMSAVIAVHDFPCRENGQFKLPDHLGA